MTKILAFIISLMLLQSAALQAQGWERLYGGGTATALTQTPDGGFLVAGVDETNWEKPDKAVLLKTGPDGELQWSRRYAIGDTLEAFTAVTHTPDGGIVVGGGATDFGPNFQEKHYAFIMKMNANGDIQWTWKTPGNWYGSEVADIKVNALGQLITGCNPSRLSSKLVALSLDGTLLWQETLANAIGSVHLLADDRIVVTGSKAWIRLTDPTGQLLWEKTYAQQLAGASLTPLAAGGFVVFGPATTGTNAKILRLDADGSQLWEKSFAAAGYGFWGSALEDQDGNFVVVNGSWSNFRLLKTDAQGNMVWIKAPYPNQLSTAAASQLIRSADGGYAFAGTRSNRLLLRKITPDFPLQIGVVSGAFYHDANDDCQRNAGEKALRHFIAQAVDAQGGIYGQTMGAAGRYAFELPYGQYEVKIIPRAFDVNNWDMCTSHSANIATNDTLKLSDIGAKSLSDCPILFAHAASGGYKFRPCTTNVITVQYSNWGTKTATNAKLELDLPEELGFQSANKSVLSQDGQKITFDLGTLDPDGEGAIKVLTTCSCDAIPGNPLCLTGHITPDTCFPATPGWDKSILKLGSVCAGQEGHFTIQNIGKGDMRVPRRWFLFYLCHPYAAGTVQLEAGEDTTVVIPNVNAYTWMWMEHDALQPYVTSPWTAIKTCNNGGVYEPQHFGESAGLPFYDIYCAEVKNSFDPNDIKGVPSGFGDENLVLTSQEFLDYVIRFQNTGNDTAFQVVIRDTLPAPFDPLSVQPGASSHPYTWKVVNNEVVFTFQNIHLPDSTTNLEGSQGFVRFRANIRPNQANGTLLQNRAAIYFDFNKPIFTNTYTHKMTEPIPVAVHDPGVASLPVLVSPNPFESYTVFTFGQAIEGVFHCYDAQGRLLHQATINGSTFRLDRENLPEGIYFYKISAQNGRAATGRLILQN